MTMAAESQWLHGECSGLVQLDTYRLFLKASGPPRASPETPVIVIEHGMGGSIAEWVAVERLVARFARVYLYERAGYHPSDPSTRDPTFANSVDDLHQLLKIAGVHPPYVLVGHSHGGPLVRQYLADHQSDVHGMVILDSAPLVTNLPPNWTELLGDSTYPKVVGLDDNNALSESEYAALTANDERNGDIAAREYKVKTTAEAPGGEAHELIQRLSDGQPLGDYPLSIIFADESNDMSKVYAYALEHGHGSPEAREVMRVRLEDMSAVDEAAMRSQLSYSRNSHFVKAQGKQRTHNVHFVDPAFVAAEIEKVFRDAVKVGS